MYTKIPRSGSAVETTLFRSSRSTASGPIMYAPGGGGSVDWEKLVIINGSSSKSWDGGKKKELGFRPEIPH